MKRRIIKVEAEKVISQFEQSINTAVRKAILDHHANGRDTYGMRNGKIVAYKPDGRVIEVEWPKK